MVEDESTVRANFVPNAARQRLAAFGLAPGALGFGCSPHTHRSSTVCALARQKQAPLWCVGHLVYSEGNLVNAFIKGEENPVECKVELARRPAIPARNLLWRGQEDDPRKLRQDEEDLYFKRWYERRIRQHKAGDP